MFHLLVQVWTNIKRSRSRLKKEPKNLPRVVLKSLLDLEEHQLLPHLERVVNFLLDLEPRATAKKASFYFLHLPAKGRIQETQPWCFRMWLLQVVAQYKRRDPLLLIVTVSPLLRYPSERILKHASKRVRLMRSHLVVTWPMRIQMNSVITKVV